MGISENELLEELAQELALPQIQPGDVTVAALSARLGVCMSTAARWLRHKAKTGELVELDAITEDGHRCKVYRKAVHP